MNKVTIEITEQDIKDQLIEKSFGWETASAVRDVLSSRRLDPLVKEVIVEKIKEALVDMDLEDIKKRAAHMVERQLRSVAIKLLKG